MSGEAGQKAELFTGHIGGLIVTLRITPGEDFLAVFVQDPSRTEVYNQEVTARFLQGSETLSGFKSYVELYQYLSQNFATVAFVSNALKFEHKGKPAFVDLVLKVRSNFPETLSSSEIADLEAQIAAQTKAL